MFTLDRLRQKTETGESDLVRSRLKSKFSVDNQNFVPEIYIKQEFQLGTVVQYMQILKFSLQSKHIHTHTHAQRGKKKKNEAQKDECSNFAAFNTQCCTPNSDPGRHLLGSDDGEMVIIKFRALSETGTEVKWHSYIKVSWRVHHYSHYRGGREAITHGLQYVRISQHSNLISLKKKHL